MRKKGNLIALSLLVAVSCSASVTASFAWFIKSTGTDISFGNTTDNYLTGAAEKSLFASGTGDADDPYIIKTPVQLYNLAWAYYSGMYDDDYPYFKLDPPSGTLNMSGYTLPPIGTEDHPFIASFDGNNKTIENLTVSNVFSDYGTAHPSVIKTGNTEITLNSSTFNPPKVVGFFGAVGPIVTNTHYSDYTGITAALTNLTLNNLSIKSETSQTLVGLAAGYVDGNMSGVKVGGNSTIDLGTSAKNYFSQDITENLSDYSLVGYSTKNNATEYYAQEVSNYYHWGAGNDPGWGGSVNMSDMYNRLYSIAGSATRNDNYAYEKDIVTKPDGTTTYDRDALTGTAWTYRSQKEGSFVFSPMVQSNYGTTSYSSRSDYMYLNGGTRYHQIKQTQVTVSGYYISSGSHYLGVNGTTVADHQDGWRIANNYITIVIDDFLYYLTHDLTLSMTQKDQWTRDNGRIYYRSSGGYINSYNYIEYYNNRWRISTSYWSSDMTSLTLTSTTITSFNESSNGADYMNYNGTNVTYFPLMTGDNNYEVVEKNTGYVIGGSEDNTPTQYPHKTGDIRVSKYSTSDIQNSYSSRTKTLTTVYTINSNLQTVAINSNDFAKFTESASKFLPSISDGNIYGLHFMPANININHLVTAEYAMINGHEKTNYKMPASSIDFNLAKKGVVNFFAGTYFDGNNSFFSLHHIERNSNDNITSIKEIAEIYQSTSNRKDYIYKYSDNTYSATLTSDSSLAFSTSRIKTRQSNSNWTNNAVYYFEIPVNAGEYALGSVNGGTGAYLMYLDIGANASAVDSISASYVKTLTAGAKFPIGVDFATTDLTGTSGGETLGVVLIPTNANSSGNTASFEVNETTITFVSTYPSSTTLQYAFNVKKVAAGSTSLGDPNYDNIIVTKLTTLNITSSDQSVWTIVLIETFDTFEATEPTSSGYYSIVCDGVGMSEENLPGEFNAERVATIKAYLTTVIKIIRDTGINTFDAQTIYLPTTTEDGIVYHIANITIDDTGITLLFEDKDETFTITVVNTENEVLHEHTGTATTNP